MATKFALEKAASAWCTPSTEQIEMIPELAEAFADIIDTVTSFCWLGNATTGYLLEELRARCEMNGTLNYRTVDIDG